MEKLISKYWDTITQAEIFQHRLYNEYEYVELVKSPRFGESGTYVWKVSNHSKLNSKGDHE